MISKVYLEGNREMKKYIKYAFFQDPSVLFGYIFLGIAFGIVLQQAGFNFIWAFLHQSFSLCRLHAVCPCAAAGFSRFAPNRRRHDTFRQQPP